MAVVEIIGVIAMTDRLMTAARPVHVGVVFQVVHVASPSRTESMVPIPPRGQGAAERP
jgi:hypothetical protein